MVDDSRAGWITGLDLKQEEEGAGPAGRRSSADVDWLAERRPLICDEEIGVMAMMGGIYWTRTGKVR